MTEEDVLPAIAAEHDVVYSAWKMDAGFACHGKKLHLIYPRVKPDPTHYSSNKTRNCINGNGFRNAPALGICSIILLGLSGR